MRAALVPFGRGPRQCVGFALAEMELVLITARLAQRIDVELRTRAMPEPDGMVVNRPRGGVVRASDRTGSPRRRRADKRCAVGVGRQESGFVSWSGGSTGMPPRLATTTTTVMPTTARNSAIRKMVAPAPDTPERYRSHRWAAPHRAARNAPGTSTPRAAHRGGGRWSTGHRPDRLRARRFDR